MTKKQRVLEAALAEADTTIDLGLDSLYDNAVFVDLVKKTTVTDRIIAKIAASEATCKAIVAAMPIYSAKTRENRKWNPQRLYGMGDQVNAIVGLATGIQYSAADHSALMLANTGISKTMINLVVDSLGNDPYYNRNYGVLVDGVKGNATELAKGIQLIGATIGVPVDVSGITPEAMEAKYTRALIRAQADEADAQKTAIANEGKIVI